MNAHAQPAHNAAQAETLMRPADVSRMTGLGLSTLYAHIARSGIIRSPVPITSDQ
jgi:predicted DNA-binding transcriptional regulator AlpA